MSHVVQVDQYRTLRVSLLAVAAVLALVQLVAAIYVTAFCRLLLSHGTSEVLMLVALGLVAVSLALRPRR